MRQLGSHYYLELRSVVRPEGLTAFIRGTGGRAESGRESTTRQVSRNCVMYSALGWREGEDRYAFCYVKAPPKLIVVRAYPWARSH